MTNTRPISLHDARPRVTSDLAWDLTVADRVWGRTHATGLLVGVALCIAGFWIPVVLVAMQFTSGR
ncbi:hypothetical protein [uncultured Microbacterium sp.]|uniref:hypothetical protein n=1 Tax=uncultured Microbacterium sp. TaxID=191216 RepID=UPI0025EDB812|nr:hypothetical protein [uncultured Microbacterium sp.]